MNRQQKECLKGFFSGRKQQYIKDRADLIRTTLYIYDFVQSKTCTYLLNNQNRLSLLYNNEC